MSVAPLDAPIFGAADFAARAQAAPAAMADLETFRRLLEERSAVMNLVGPSALRQFWDRHAFDSAQILQLAPHARTFADIGAGAGFPGVVLAILLKGRPGARVILVDSLAKRCRFLSEVVEALALPAQVVNGRAETMALPCEVVAARAVAPLVKLLGYAAPTLNAGATGLFLKGAEVEEELAEAVKSWRFSASLKQSLSRPDGRVVEVKGPIRAI